MNITKIQAIPDILEEHHIPYKQNGKSFILTCPRCSKKDKLYIRKADGVFVCWYCKEISNFKGAPEFAIAALLNVPTSQARHILYGDTQQATTSIAINVKDFYDNEEEAPAPEPLEHIYPPDIIPIDSEWALPGREYLNKRGIPMDIALQYGLHYWTTRQRVVFPIIMSGKLCGWQARAIGQTKWYDEEQERTVEIPKMLGHGKKDATLMFYDNLKGSDHAIIAEGPIDAIKCHLCGGNVATMGKAVSKRQIELIKESGVKKVYLGLDPDAAKEVARLVKDFADLPCYQLLPKNGFEDLGAMTPEAVLEQFLVAAPINRSKVFVHVKAPKIYSF